MYQLNGIEPQRESHQGLNPGWGDIPRLSEHRDGTGGSKSRLRVVRAPGGFAFVEDKAAAAESGRRSGSPRTVEARSDPV